MVIMDLKIRMAKETEISECARILLEEFSKQGEPWSLETAKARLSELFKNNPDLCFCLELNEEIVGFSFAERFKYAKGNYLWISELAVSSEQQGKGFGLQALKFMENLAEEQDFDALILAANRDEKAFKIYEKFGFKPTNYEFMEKEL